MPPSVSEELVERDAVQPMQTPVRWAATFREETYDKPTKVPRSMAPNVSLIGHEDDIMSELVSNDIVVSMKTDERGRSGNALLRWRAATSAYMIRRDHGRRTTALPSVYWTEAGRVATRQCPEFYSSGKQEVLVCGSVSLKMDR